jgi:hypothetical protein
MAAQLVRTIGKSQVTIIVERCVDCGVPNSPSWTDERRHQIVIGDRRDYITLKRCAACSAKAGRPVQYDAPTALQRRFEAAR